MARHKLLEIEAEDMKRYLNFFYNLIPGGVIKRTFLKKWIHRKYIPRNIDVFLINGSNMLMHADSSPLAIFMYWLGKCGYEAREIELWESLCERATNIVEIGGNIGLYTIFGVKANPAANYKVFEPVPYNYQLLLKNLKLNSLTNVIATQAAVISNPNLDQVTFFLPQAESHYEAATGGFIEGAESIDRVVDRELTVKALQSRNVVDGCDLLKLDVEGAEFEILNGCTESINEARTIIIVEMRRRTHKLRHWIVSLIDNCSYGAWALSDIGLWYEVPSDKIPSIVLQEDFGTRDLLLCPCEKVSLIDELLS